MQIIKEKLKNKEQIIKPIFVSIIIIVCLLVIGIFFNKSGQMQMTPTVVEIGVIKPAEVENSEIYHADRVGLWLQKFDSAYSSGSLTEPIIWPIQSLRLSDIPDGGLTKWDPPGAILHGQDAETIFQLFQERITDWGIVFVDGDQRYVVFARPLMPHEYTATLAPLTPSLHCLPEDGWISLP